MDAPIECCSKIEIYTNWDSVTWASKKVLNYSFPNMKIQSVCIPTHHQSGTCWKADSCNPDVYFLRVFVGSIPIEWRFCSAWAGHATQLPQSLKHVASHSLNYEQLLAVRLLMAEIRLTSWYGKYPIIYRVSYIPGDARFQPSTVVLSILIWLLWKIHENPASVKAEIYWDRAKTASFTYRLVKNVSHQR